MKQGSDPEHATMKTQIIQIVEQARRVKGEAVQTLMHCIDENWLHEAYRKTRKDGATGIDRQTGSEYGTNLGENLKGLLERMRSGKYKAPTIRRVRIPKDDGGERMLGITTFEDKIVQRAVTMLLEPVYEPEFYPCSYGFRPKKSAHQALTDLRRGIVENQAVMLIDADIKGCFDNISHQKLIEVIKERVVDGTLIRFIGKWLNAGVLDGGEIINPETGTPQGGVVSPILANIFLHTVLDEWWHKTVQPRLKKRSFLIRYADDFVIGFESEDDAQRVYEVLPKRFSKYGLTIHPEKTRLVNIGKPKGPASKGETFNFLGFTHYWAKSRKGYWVIKRKTMKKRLQRACKAIWQWCKEHRHETLQIQHRKLNQKLQGYYNYYAVRCNSKALDQVYRQVKRSWKHWLNRRGNQTWLTFECFNRIEQFYPLAKPRIKYAL